MVELTAISPCAGLLPVTKGTVTLSELDLGPLTSVAPFKGQEKAVCAAMKDAHGVAYPAANRMNSKAGVQALWFGQGQALLTGAKADVSIAGLAALTDQSDAWTVVELKGDRAADVLARLVSIDLRPSEFKRGHSVRCELMHMMASVTKTGADSFQIMVFRSMAKTLIHDLTTAMGNVNARVIA